jgi:hypothetical protein
MIDRQSQLIRYARLALAGGFSPRAELTGMGASAEEIQQILRVIGHRPDLTLPDQCGGLFGDEQQDLFEEAL